ncbi:MAG TPA: metallophosphoesterase family protein, partial [Dehalococcoidia bacterium]|nr:metallophosphoesterase family protein [Dehalococcoidia bacterium]
MRIAVVADVHANLAALEAVLRHAEGQRALDGLWCLGDLVGYGPDPGACIALLRRYPLVGAAGNHDWAAIGRLSTEEFNPDAAAAALWTAQQLTLEERGYLDGLPEVVEEGDFTLAHGTLRWPIWEYLVSQESAMAHLERQGTHFGLVGHTHVAMLVVEEEAPPGGHVYEPSRLVGAELSKGRATCRLSPLHDGQTVSLGDRRLVINPGGVGQPRDGDPRASYAVLDADARTITIHRVEYDIAATQKKMARAGLPAWLI